MVEKRNSERINDEDVVSALSSESLKFLKFLITI